MALLAVAVVGWIRVPTQFRVPLVGPRPRCMPRKTKKNVQALPRGLPQRETAQRHRRKLTRLPRDQNRRPPADACRAGLLEPTHQKPTPEPWGTAPLGRPPAGQEKAQGLPMSELGTGTGGHGSLHPTSLPQSRIAPPGQLGCSQTPTQRVWAPSRNARGPERESPQKNLDHLPTTGRTALSNCASTGAIRAAGGTSPEAPGLASAKPRPSSQGA